MKPDYVFCKYIVKDVNLWRIIDINLSFYQMTFSLQQWFRMRMSIRRALRHFCTHETFDRMEYCYEEKYRSPPIKGQRIHYVTLENGKMPNPDVLICFFGNRREIVNIEKRSLINKIMSA
ncbi:MAG TPA: hypothetical protein VIE65_12400 [Methylobacter sp.]|jgi:hypothetical protein